MSPASRALAGAAGGGSAGALVWFLLRLAGTDLPLVFPIACGVCAVLAAALLRLAGADVAPVLRRPRDEPASRSRLAPRGERQLRSALEDRRVYVAVIQPALREIVAARLQSRGSMHRTSSSGSADGGQPGREQLGEELWRCLTTTAPNGPPPTLSEVDRIVRAIERL